MEYKNVTNLLDATSDNVARFLNKKWIEVHDQSGNAEDRYKPRKQIRFKTSMLRSDLCDFSDAYIVVEGTNTVTNPNNDLYDKKLTFTNNVPFFSCISKTNNTLIDNAEDLDIVMHMYNLIEYSKNYSKTTGSFWNYYRDEPNSGTNNNLNYSVKDSKFFDYKTSITGKLERNNTEKEVEIVLPLKKLSNFLSALDIPLINFEINLILTWSGNFVATSKATRDAVSSQGGNPAVPAIDNPTNSAFKTTKTKLHISVSALSTENDKRLLEELRA